jgi:hypothetical protein
LGVFHSPQTGRPIALREKDKYALEECMTIGNYSAKFNN